MSALTYRTLGYHETPVRVRFGEVDNYGYFWHGHVFAHFEFLRMDLARNFNFRTPQLLESEMILPMLEATCVYKNPCFEDEVLLIQGTVLKPNKPDPFLVIDYRAVKEDSGQEVFRGRTRQVFKRRDGRMTTRIPEVIRTRLVELWNYLEKQPSWPDVNEAVPSSTANGGDHVG